jgi:hypothetical protein
MIEDAIRSILVTAATAAGSRIALDIVPEQTTRPYVRIQQLGGAVLLAQDGAAGMREYGFQVSAFAGTGAAARSLIEQCRAALHMYRGTVGSDTIQAIYARSEVTVQFEIEVAIYHASMDFEAGYVG